MLGQSPAHAVRLYGQDGRCHSTGARLVDTSDLYETSQTLPAHQSHHPIMPHITLPDGLPGITGPLKQYPDTAEHLLGLAQTLLRGESTLTPGERELIAAYVSSRNDCYFCTNSHSATARHLLGDTADVVEQVKRDVETAEVSEKMKALLVIAGKVQQGGRRVSDAEVERARGEGATDKEIHDTVLIAAAFCMYNRYVDGLATWAPQDEALYEQHGADLATRGYVAR